MQACGISIYRLLRPVLLLAVVSVGGDVVHHDRGRPDGQSDVSRDRLRHHLGARRERDQAARLLRGLPQPRPLRRRRPGRRRLARVLPGRHVASPISRPSSPPRPAGWHRPRQAHAWTWCSPGARGMRRPLSDPAKYEVARFAELILGPRPQHGVPRHRHPEGRQRDDDPRARGPGRRAARSRACRCTARSMALHRKFALPFACLVLRGDRTGARACSTARGGKLAAFVPGIAVVFVYYVIEYGGRQMAKGQLMPRLAGRLAAQHRARESAGVALLLWRARSADKPIRLHAAGAVEGSGPPRRRAGAGRRDVQVAHGGRAPPARLAAAGRPAARHLRRASSR